MNIVSASASATQISLEVLPIIIATATVQSLSSDALGKTLQPVTRSVHHLNKLQGQSKRSKNRRMVRIHQPEQRGNK